MASGWNWETGEGLTGVDDPAEVDAAFERGAGHLGTAAIGLALTCPLEEASPRIVLAARLPDRRQRSYAFTAVAQVARLHGELTPELYAVLRAESPVGTAGDAIDDVLSFVPFRDLPPWLKRRWVLARLRNRLWRA
ncbi:hypothetical protein ABZ871_17725 [Streptomyces populi]